MPQDSLRSVVYRSFVTCDDPKGVVQCGTIRKSKTASHKIINQQQQASNHESNRSLESLIEREEMGSRRSSQEFHHNSSSLQLLEVSRGAEKLNQMIGSWSGRMSLDGGGHQSGDVARDLLKGALDLQESLVMLGKLQEASKYMARLKKLQKDKSKREMVDGGLLIERSRSDRFVGQTQNQNQNGGFEKHRLSVDGPSRDCIDQLREVIRDSFARHNLRAEEEKSCFHQRSFDSDLEMEMPFTSSSFQSSTDHSISISNRFGSTVSSVSPAATRNKPKGPSLIAKLMGLEDIPIKPVQPVPQKQLVESKQDLSNVQFKRVLKGDSVKEFNFKPQSNHKNVDDIAPIVLIKPMRARFNDFESLEPTTCWEEETLKTKKFLRQLKMKCENPPKIVKCSEEVLDSKMLGKGGQEETQLRKFGQEVKKPDEKVVKTKGRASYKPKGLENTNGKEKKKEAIDKRVDKIQKVASASTSRKMVEKEIVKKPQNSRSQDQARVTKTRPGKSESGSNIGKLQNPEKQNTNPRLISKSTRQVAVHNSSSGRKKNQAEKEKQKRKPVSAPKMTEKLALQEEDKEINPTSENELAEKETNSTVTDHLSTKEETDASEVRSAEKETDATFTDHHTTKEEIDASELQIEEDCTSSTNALFRTIMLSPEHESDTKTTEKAIDSESHDNVTDCKSSKGRTKLKAFLLGSPSFLSHVEELFDLNISFPFPLQAPEINDCGVASAELSLACANELVKRRSLPDSRMIHPLLLTCSWNTRICLSLDQLMEEVCDGIETLRSYTDVVGGKENVAAVDNLYATLERDMMSNGVVNGTWDLGWRSGFSVEEAEQVVNDVEKLILSQLIEEAFCLV